MDIYGFGKLFSIKTILLPIKLRLAIRQMRKLIRQKDITAVIATGAYISYPPGYAAYKEKIPLFLMESNVNPGKSISLLCNKAKVIFTSFKESESFFKSHLKSKIVYYGNPVRKDILSPIDKSKARKLFGLKDDVKTLLVFGGSLGAKSINNAVLNLLKDERANDIQILWQTGKNFNIPKDLPKNVVVATFINDMATAYACADFVISRSGATTVSELEIVGKPAFLVPLPSASNNEQAHNARVLNASNSCVMIDNSMIETNISDVFNYLYDDNRLNEMSSNLKSLAKPSAAEDTAKHIVQILK
jgi:UDP-N-acetylglucosamine--N-acetylmuramyl-(pentapeptide) pyrophosphoryl-undecaprenol N-acetylglucosamine transferase